MFTIVEAKRYLEIRYVYNSDEHIKLSDRRTNEIGTGCAAILCVGNDESTKLV